MDTKGEMIVVVQQAWNDWRTAEVRLADLHDIHWRQPIGAPCALAHGYISCTSVTAGSLPHNCDRTQAPHRLQVCVLKKHSAPSAYAAVVERANTPREVSVPERLLRSAIGATIHKNAASRGR